MNLVWTGSKLVSNGDRHLHTRFLANPYLLLTITALFWGGNAVAGKLAVGHISPFTLTTFRWLTACIVLFPFALPHLRKDWPTIRRTLPYLFLFGATGFAIFNNLMYLALNYTSAINVAIEQASMPLFVFALNFILFQIRTTWLRIGGYMLTLLGVLVTATGGKFSGAVLQNLNIGDVLMICGMMTYGIYSVFLRNKPDIHLLGFIFVLAVSAFVTSLPFTAYEAATQKMILPDMQGLGVILYTGVFPSIISQLFWVRGLDLVGSNLGGLFVNLVPIFGALLAILILGEQFQLFHAIALTLVLSGIWIAQKAAG